MSLISVVVTMGVAAALLLHQGEAQLKQANHLKHMEMRAHERATIQWVREAVNCSMISQLTDGVQLESNTTVLTGMHGSLEVKARVTEMGVQLSTQWHRRNPHTGVVESRSYPTPICVTTPDCQLIRRGNSINYELQCN